MHINALRSELENKAVPLCLRGGEGLQPDHNGIRELLGQQVLHSKILKLPIGNVLPLVIRDLGWVLGRGAWDGAFKIGPMTGHLHRFLEVHGKNGPV